MNFDLWDLAFVLLCIFLLIIMVSYIYSAENYKKNYEELCTKDKNRICTCFTLNEEVNGNELEKNSS